MRTPTILCLGALASAAIAAPTAFVAHDALSKIHFGSVSSNAQGPATAPSWPQSGSTATPGAQAGTSSAGNGTTTRATAAQQQGVVMIDTVLPGGEGAGSGMVLTSDGTVLTNYHVVSGSTLIRVTIPNGHAYMADVVGHDQTHDVAVLKLRHASNLKTVTLDTGAVQLAESVLAVGQGEGEGVLYAATGKVLSTNAQITAKDDASLATSETLTGLIRTDAPIVPGYSGGPLFDASGKVIGIDTAASAANSLAGYASSGSRGQVEGFAIPIGDAKSIADDILSGKKTTTNHIGSRAALGVSVQPTQDTRSGANAGAASGVTVMGVVSGQGAEAAGLTVGDVITSIAGHSIANSTDLSHALDHEYPGAKVTVSWTDAYGTAHTANVTLDTATTN